MPTNKSLSLAITAGLLSLLAACGSTDKNGVSGPAEDPATSSAAAAGEQAPGKLAIPADADPETKKMYITENAIAACMARRGFSYLPQAPTASGPDDAGIDATDYAVAKKYRSKYGYGFYAPAVYPDDPKVRGSRASENAPGDNPNGPYLSKLTPSQKAAYDLALSGPPLTPQAKKEMPKGACVTEGQIAAYGSPKSASEQKKADAAEAEKNRAAGQALNGDPQLVKLAQEYASCLSAQGITVTTTQPTGIADAVKFDLSSKMPPDGIMNLDRSTALSLLTKEISSATKDLECGKDFRAAYFPKLKANPYSEGQG